MTLRNAEEALLSGRARGGAVWGRVSPPTFGVDVEEVGGEDEARRHSADGADELERCLGRRLLCLRHLHGDHGGRRRTARDVAKGQSGSDRAVSSRAVCSTHPLMAPIKVPMTVPVTTPPHLAQYSAFWWWRQPIFVSSIHQ